MSFDFQSELERHRRHLFEVKRRPKELGTEVGFVVDYSDDLLLLHRLDKDTFRFNGYTAIRDKDIRLYRFFYSREFWQYRAVRLFKLTPRPAHGISVKSLPDLVASLSRRFPLITIHRERIDPDICYVGRVISFTQTTFKIDDLDSNAEWTGPRLIKFKDVTRIDFGGGYEEALAGTAPKKRKMK